MRRSSLVSACAIRKTCRKIDRCCAPCFVSSVSFQSRIVRISSCSWRERPRLRTYSTSRQLLAPPNRSGGSASTISRQYPASSSLKYAGGGKGDDGTALERVAMAAADGRDMGRVLPLQILHLGPQNTKDIRQFSCLWNGVLQDKAKRRDTVGRLRYVVV